MGFLRKGILVSGGQIFAVLLNTLVNILFARTLGPNGVGQFELFRNTQLIVVTVMAMGIGNGTIYFLNNLKVSPGRIVTNTIKSTYVTGLVLITGLVTTILACRNYFPHESFLTVLIFSIGSAALLVSLVLRPVLTAQLAAKRMVAISVITPLIMLIGVGFMVVRVLVSRAPIHPADWRTYLHGHLHVHLSALTPSAALLFLAAGGIAACLLVLFFVRKHIDLSQPFEMKLFIDLAKIGLPLAVANLLYVASLSITVILLRYLHRGDFSSIGLYTRAVGISGMVTIVPVAIGPLLYARWAGMKGEARAKQGEMAVRLNVAYGAIACLALLKYGAFIVTLLYGARFVHAYAAIRILAPSLIFLTVFGVCDNMLASDGRAIITVCILVGTVAVIALVARLAIPLLDIRGAALAALCGNVFTATAGLIICSKFYGIRIWRCLLISPSDVRFIYNALVRPTKSQTVG